MIANGVDINGSSALGRTALFFAAAGGHGAVVRQLLSAGAEVVTDVQGTTILMAAARGNISDFVQSLIDGGAELEARNDLGKTALMCASENGAADAARVLLKNGASVKTVDRFGRNLLHGAAKENKAAIVPIALRAGVPVDACDIDCMTPLMLAAERGKMVVAVLISAGADVFASCQRCGEMKRAVDFVPYSGADAVRELLQREMDRRLVAALRAIARLPEPIRREIVAQMTHSSTL